MSAVLKPIPTLYGGHRFLSRTEAKWAVFFDSLEVKWEYEHQGYDLDGDWYLPDFWLPREQWYVEIKPKAPNEREERVARLLEEKSSKPVLLFHAMPSTVSETVGLAWYRYMWKDPTQITLRVCSLCGSLAFGTLAQGFVVSCERGCKLGDNLRWEAVAAAMRAARQARFDNERRVQSVLPEHDRTEMQATIANNKPKLEAVREEEARLRLLERMASGNISTDDPDYQRYIELVRKRAGGGGKFDDRVRRT